MIWRQEGAPASICFGVDIIPVDKDEARLEPLSRVVGILGADGERLSYQWRGVSQSATSIYSAQRRSSAASICSVWHRSSIGLMRRSSSVDDLAVRRSSGLNLLRP
jgi:hypothetical protein